MAVGGPLLPRNAEDDPVRGLDGDAMEAGRELLERRDFELGERARQPLLEVLHCASMAARSERT